MKQTNWYHSLNISDMGQQLGGIMHSTVIAIIIIMLRQFWSALMLTNGVVILRMSWYIFQVVLSYVCDWNSPQRELSVFKTSSVLEIGAFAMSAKIYQYCLI